MKTPYGDHEYLCFYRNKNVRNWGCRDTLLLKKEPNLCKITKTKNFNLRESVLPRLPCQSELNDPTAQALADCFAPCPQVERREHRARGTRPQGGTHLSSYSEETGSSQACIENNKKIEKQASICFFLLEKM